MPWAAGYLDLLHPKDPVILKTLRVVNHYGDSSGQEKNNKLNFLWPKIARLGPPF